MKQTKKVKSFTLSDKSIEFLMNLAAEQGRSLSNCLDHLIKQKVEENGSA